MIENILSDKFKTDKKLTTKLSLGDFNIKNSDVEIDYNKFITVRKEHPDYIKLMNGTYSSKFRSIPLEAFNPNPNAEFAFTTFELIPVVNIIKESYIRLFYEIVKPQYFLILLGPVLFCLISIAKFQIVLNWVDVVLLLSSLFSVSAFVNIQRTLVEHFSNTTLFATAPTSNILKKGLVTASQLKIISKFFLLISFLLSIPLILKNTIPVLTVIGLSFLFLNLINRKSKYGENIFSLLFSALSHFLVSGPLLTLGVFLVFVDSVHFDIKLLTTCLVYGTSWGLWVLLLRQLRSFRKIFLFSKSKIYRFSSVIGFDRSLQILQKSIIIFPLVSTALLALIPNGWLLCLVSSVVHSNFMIKEINLLNKIQSTFASASEELSEVSMKHHYVLAISQTIAFIFFKL